MDFGLLCAAQYQLGLKDNWGREAQDEFGDDEEEDNHGAGAEEEPPEVEAAGRMAGQRRSEIQSEVLAFLDS